MNYQVKIKTKDTETGIVGSAIEFDAETKIEDFTITQKSNQLFSRK